MPAAEIVSAVAAVEEPFIMGVEDLADLAVLQDLLDSDEIGHKAAVESDGHMFAAALFCFINRFEFLFIGGDTR